MTATAPPVISVELPEPFDARWSRLPGVAIEGHVITIDPAQYFFRFDSSSWLVCDWDGVREELLDLTESTETALEQISLDFIRATAGQPATRPRSSQLRRFLLHRRSLSVSSIATTFSYRRVAEARVRSMATTPSRPISNAPSM